MLHRRYVIQGFTALGVASVCPPIAVLGQGRQPTKIRYNEVVRSLLYAPAYVAMTNGYFKDTGLDVSITTANGGDKSMAALISDSADIALIGPETAIYVLNSDSSTKVRIFCGLTSTDGFMLVGRANVNKFDWNMLKGSEILGFRPGSTPLLFLEEAMRLNGIMAHGSQDKDNTPFSSSRMLLSLNSTARLISLPQSAPRSALPITRRSWRRRNTSKIIPRSSRIGPTRSIERRNGRQPPPQAISLRRSMGSSRA